MKTNFNQHLTVFHVKCKVKDCKTRVKQYRIYFLSVFVYKTRIVANVGSVSPNGKTDKMYI